MIAISGVESPLQEQLSLRICIKFNLRSSKAEEGRANMSGIYWMGKVAVARKYK